MELILILAIFHFPVFLIDLFEVAQVIGACGIHTFVEDEVLPVLFWTRAWSQWGQRSLMEEKRLSFGENLAPHTLQRTCPLEPLFLYRYGIGASQRGQVQS